MRVAVRQRVEVIGGRPSVDATANFLIVPSEPIGRNADIPLAARGISSDR